jgi:hypothetical protein
MAKSDKIQGEGNYEAAEQYNKSQQKFVKSGQVEEAAREAEPRSETEKQEMEQAEQTGRSHAKEEDPAIKRPATDKPGNK